MSLGDAAARLVELFVYTKPSRPRSQGWDPGQELALHEAGCSHSPHGLYTSVFLLTHLRASRRARDLAKAQQLAHRAGTVGLGG